MPHSSLPRPHADRNRWHHSNDVRDRQLARSLGYRIMQTAEGWIITDRKDAGSRGPWAVYAGPRAMRGNIRDDLARLGRNLILAGTVTLTDS